MKSCSGLSSLGDLSLNSGSGDVKPCDITRPRIPLTPQNSVDLSEAEQRRQSEAGSTKSKTPNSPTNGETLLDIRYFFIFSYF